MEYTITSTALLPDVQTKALSKCTARWSMRAFMSGISDAHGLLKAQDVKRTEYLGEK